MVALIPMFYFTRLYQGKKAFWGGYLIGLFWSSGTLYWIGWATLPGLIGTLLVNSLYIGLFSFLQSYLFQKLPKTAWMATPFLWVGIELFASTGDTGFPWNLLGHTFTNFPEMIQYASVTGVYGVSFVIVLINSLLFQSMKMRSIKQKYLYFGIACILIVIPFIQGRILFAQANQKQHAQTLKVALIQGNLDPYRRWTPDFVDSSFQVYEAATLELSNESLDLIVWPESASPCYINHRYSCQKRVKHLVNATQIPILTGAPDFEWGRTEEKDLRVYNSAFLVEPNQYIMNKYNKTKLVPFSERIPFISGIRPVYKALKQLIMDIGDFTPGDSIVVFNAESMNNQHPFSCGICFDSVFPFLMKKFVLQGAQFLVVITNDGWFGRTSGPYQHRNISIMRAVENRRWVARCANTGISTFIDPLGRMHGKTPLYHKASLSHQIYPETKLTFFTRYGEWFAYLIGLVNVFVFIQALGIGYKLKKKI